jgi:WG repeat protein
MRKNFKRKPKMKIWLYQRIIGVILIAQILPTILAAAATHVVQVTETKWDEIKEFSDGLAGVCSNGQWGFIDTSGKIAIAVQGDWKYAYPFKDGLAQVDVGGANFDFIDKTGQRLVRLGQGETNANIAWPRMLITSRFRNLSFSYGLIPVQNKLGKLGFMNQKGQLIVTPQWDQVSDFHEGLACVSIYNPSNHTSRAGFINTNGQIEIPLQWNGASSFSEGLAAVSTNGLCGFIDKSGRMVIPPSPAKWVNRESLFLGGFALVISRDYKFGVIDRTGKIILEPEFTGFELGNQMVVLQKDKNAIIDKSGHVAGDFWWDSIQDPPMLTMANDIDPVEYRPKVANDYTVKVKKDNKWGLVDINGKIVVQSIWEDVGFSESGFTPVKQDGKWGLLDSSGKLVIQPQWEAVNYPALAGKIITAKKNGKWGLFNLAGKVAAKPEWDAVSTFSEGLAAVQVADKWGLIDQSGKIICPPQWDWAESPHDGLLRVCEGKKWFLMRIEHDQGVK